MSKPIPPKPAPLGTPGKAERFYRYVRGKGAQAPLLAADVLTVQDGRVLKRERLADFDMVPITQGKVSDAMGEDALS